MTDDTQPTTNGTGMPNRDEMPKRITPGVHPWELNLTDRDEDTEQELTNWWMDQASQEIRRTVPKAVEYTSTDLIDIGRQLARMRGPEIDDDEAAELGVAFYAAGKLARIMGALTAGRRPSRDSWFDLAVYAKMAMRVHDVGSWPGVDLTETESDR